ncbi:MAG: FKBP-type peptidyl-prolyl cis-trans isomerase [Clostridia bacterium]|nr:FKBP-type peptidyl-prolyl cis-trans isomerase [Clostridia bacterium]
MKKIISLCLVVLLIVTTLTACGGGRAAFDCNLKDYVTLSDYKAISVSKTSEDYLYYYDNLYSSSISNANLYTDATEGTVKNGDIVNIDYTGKINGVKFEGGEATGQNLTLGSGQFIPGFESQIVGKKIGTTFDINVTFPTNYGSADLAGKDAVFTIKLNSAKILPEISDEIAIKLGFKTSDDLIAELDKYALENCIADALVKGASVSGYPKKDQKNYDELYEKSIQQFQTALDNYNTTSNVKYNLDMYMSAAVGMTSAEYKNYVYKQMENIMVFYAVLDDAGLKITDEDINKAVKSLVTEQMSEAQVKENYEDWSLEIIAVQTIVLDYLKTIATIN